MQSDCAACHSMLPYFSLIDNAARGCNVVEPKAAELVVVDEAQPAAAAAAPLRGGEADTARAARQPLVLYTAGDATAPPRMVAAVAVCQERKKRALASPVWL
ncbi:hypothetical protein ABZP36_032807 [Zizania latifolia]